MGHEHSWHWSTPGGTGRGLRDTGLKPAAAMEGCKQNNQNGTGPIGLKGVEGLSGMRGGIQPTGPEGICPGPLPTSAHIDNS